MNKNEFEKVYKTYYNSIYAYIKKKILHKQDSEELTSDVFTNFYRRIESFDEAQCSISTWLYTIAANRLKNYYRERKDDISLEGTELAIISDKDTPEKALELEQMRQELLEALDMLKVRERRILIQRFYQGKSCAQVAANMGLSEVNVRVIQKRSLEKLRKILININDTKVQGL